MTTQPKFILVINCGSSSLKFALIEPASKEQPLTGIAQCLNSNEANIVIKHNGEKHQDTLDAPFGHKEALANLINYLTQAQLIDVIAAIGHRVVHAGERYQLPTLIDNKVMATLEELCTLAPLHNPANIIGIEAARAAFEALPQVAVFDTAFHQTMPEKAYTYALPRNLYSEHGVRKYGFHGTSHYYVSRQAADYLNKNIDDTSVITAHLGNGCSITAIENGESRDTSMGFTPLAGVAMGTRCGDIDPGIIFHLLNNLNYSTEAVDKLLNKESGLLGISEISNDCRTLEEQALEQNNPQAKLALDVFCFSIAKAIAAMTTSLSKLDAVIFTGGIGENSSYVRQEVIKQLSLLQLFLDDTANEKTIRGQAGNIASDNSPVILVIPTDEEWVIASQTLALIKG
ncbi:MAG: acetate kinase [Colwelliaceae bacterium]|nr:acetate kinase [Colwelliaceae bacterium]